MIERRRVLNEPSYLLHQRAYSETSLLLDVFSRNHGRVTLVAKGVKRKKSRTRGILVPFQSLIIAWSGRGEVKTLTSAESLARRKEIQGRRLFCGYYINELILRMLHRNDSHEILFDAYESALEGLVWETDLERTLRIFEKRLLQELGYGLHLSTDTLTGAAIESSTRYRYVAESGPLIDKGEEHTGIVLHGESLQALQNEEDFSALHRRELKRLTRAALDRHLEGRPLHSREFFSRIFPQENEKAALGKTQTIMQHNISGGTHGTRR
jgi:DNA repair protein RecO (recombination protein O)